MRGVALLALVVAVALVAAGEAAARRAPTTAERTAIAAAVKAYRDDELGVLAKRWALLNRCGVQTISVSTVDPRWALFVFRQRFREGTSRQTACRAAGGTPEAAFVVKRTGTRWKVTGWIYGERSGLCHEIAETKIPLKVFDDLYGTGFWSKQCR